MSGQRVGTIKMRVSEHFSSMGRTLRFEVLGGPYEGSKQVYGISPSNVIPEIDPRALGDGAVIEVTMRVIRLGRPRRNPFAPKKRRGGK